MTTAVLIAVLAVSPPVNFEGGAFAPDAGATYTYKTETSSEMTSPFGDFTTDVTLVQKIEVTGMKDGWYNVVTTVTENEIESDTPGNEGDQSMLGLVTVAQVSADRRMKDWSVEDNGEAAEMVVESMSGNKKSLESLGFQTLVLPKDEMKVGSKWEVKALPPATGFGGAPAEVDGDLIVSYTVVEFSKVKGVDVVVISANTVGEFDMTIFMDQGDFSMSVENDMKSMFSVRMSDGAILSMETGGTSTMDTDFGVIETEIKSKMDLVTG